MTPTFSDTVPKFYTMIKISMYLVYMVTMNVTTNHWINIFLTWSPIWVILWIQVLYLLLKSHPVLAVWCGCHVVVRIPVYTVPVAVESQGNHQKAGHDASSHWTHRCTLHCGNFWLVYCCQEMEILLY